MGKVKDWMMELEEKGLIPHPDSYEGYLRDTNMISEKDIEDYKSDNYKQPDSIRAEVLNEANSIVNGARATTYGGPEDSFKAIGQLWQAYAGVAFTPSDVAIMLALLKVARLKTSSNHRDSWVDLAGYAACGAECGLK